MNTLLEKLATAWKGYTPADVESLRLKLDSDEAWRPDGYIEVTQQELRALRGLQKRNPYITVGGPA